MIDVIRDKIDEINGELVKLVARRTELVRQLGRVKKELKLPIYVASREEEVLISMRALAKKEGISASVIEEIMHLIIEYSKLEQELAL